MTAIEPETPRYHFITPTLKTDRPALSRPPPSEIHHKNAKISFKYLAECQEKEKKMMSPKTDIYRFVLPQDQKNEPFRNQTFSHLSRQHKYSRKTQGIELVSNSALAPKYPFNLYNKNDRPEASKKGLERTEEPKTTMSSRLREKENQRELGELKKQNDKLQQKLQQLIFDNELLRVRAEDSKKQLSEHQDLVVKLKKELKNSSQRNDQLFKELQQITIQKKQAYMELQTAKKQINETLTSKQKLVYVSGVFDVIYEHHGDYLLRATKQNSLSTLVQSYQQEYKQIANFLGLQISLPNSQDVVMSQLRHLKKQIQALSRQGIRASEAEKQKAKLSHILRKNQVELSKLCSQNCYLSNELSKHIRLIDEYNHQIEVLRLKELQRRINKHNSH